MKPLVVIPTYLTNAKDGEVLAECLRTIRDTDGELVDTLVVDDGSPAQDVLAAVEAMPELTFEVYRKDTNSGFARTVNFGLQRALDEGRDAILCNADIEFMAPGWVEEFRNTRYAMDDGVERDAWVVGALLAYPNGLIQHGGIYFSMLYREFDHFYKYAPMNLPEALVPRMCPVTAALQYVRHVALEQVGLYDENFFMGWEDMDYCIRTFLHGEACIYNPNVRAFHHESLFRGRPSPKLQQWQSKSWLYLVYKYREQSFAGLVPFT